ncbi:FecR domain-containing protein [Thalassolituus sp. UBA2590]|uniref:FecR domain-containing protein n=1 Tax=Thalassolituus sp. UBA2590 TaxID=1947663 RepID=UPI0026475D10|nr:FecR domain-containing protein [Thalassolituus sp. UBA2590]
MNRHVQSRKRLGSALLTLTALAAAIHAHAQEAGVLAGLKGSVTVYRNDQSLTANSGEPIFPGDRIESGSGQLFQLLLRDESTFTFGEGSVISLDKFEYDAHKNSGNLQITQESGQLKFATGRIADGSLSAFRILQPSTEVAVLGTMGVTAILSPDQVSMHFPDIQLPPDSGPLSYSSLMGPGPYSSIPTGTFVVTAEGQSITVDQPEGSVIAAEGMPPVFFFAPPLTFEQPQASKESDTEQNNGTLSDINGVNTDDPADARAQENANRRSSDESRQQSRRESQQYINDFQVQRIIERMETRFGLPDEFDPAFTPEQPAESPSQPGPPFPQEPEPQEPEPEEPAIEPEPPVTEPQEPGTGSGLPTNPGGDPLDPIGPGTGLDPLDPGPGMICPGDPECP